MKLDPHPHTEVVVVTSLKLGFLAFSKRCTTDGALLNSLTIFTLLRWLLDGRHFNETLCTPHLGNVQDRPHRQSYGMYGYPLYRSQAVKPFPNLIRTGDCGQQISVFANRGFKLNAQENTEFTKRRLHCLAQTSLSFLLLIWVL